VGEKFVFEVGGTFGNADSQFFHNGRAKMSEACLF
jgi:hypothetical protein